MATNGMARENLDGLGIFSLMITALALPPRRAGTSRRSQVGLSSVWAAVVGVGQRLLERLGEWAWRAQQSEIEAYLARSRDIFELEARMRDLERRRPFLVA